MNRYYEGLILDIKWWKSSEDIELRYVIDVKSVIREIETCEVKFAPTMELFYQSNHSLIPMKTFVIADFEEENLSPFDELVTPPPEADEVAFEP